MIRLIENFLSKISNIHLIYRKLDPTIKHFPSGVKSQSDAANYDGGRTSGDIVNWALEKHSER